MKRVKLYRPDGSAEIEVGAENLGKLLTMGWVEEKPTKPKKQTKEDKKA